ncbi:PSP1-domain-containing protein [Lichtheimia hyalospora FSU 10163]|nr:PSP1-domain-containing protein [Lichtheimia hyalospora FSU 10163]
MGKGVPLLELLHDDTITLFTVELAPGKHDIYYMQHDDDDDQVLVKEGDLVIVEADRGQDMGQVKGIYAKTSTTNDNKDDDNTTCVRRLYRLATREEIATLPTKAQDEAKALLVCQSKIKERELPMQVLRAEYQWDRRKLTFHFTAEERVDFRELVRELFKLYKTRIWMCAINNKHHSFT